MQRPDLPTLFFRGDYQDVVALGSRDPDGAARLRHFSYLVGALAYTGRRDEAAALLADRDPHLNAEERTACRFFLGLAYCRAGEYTKGRALVNANLKTSRAIAINRRIEFFAYQGLGFYLYVSARFGTARLAAERAWSSASFARFGYGIALATDLMGHLLVQTGDIYAGIQRLQAAEVLARELGDGGLADSIQISTRVYTAQFGLEPTSALATLKRALESLKPQNSHAQANLLLELANQQLLRGGLQAASETLDRASTLIYRSQHRRYGHLLSLRRAEAAYRSGQDASALHAARSVAAALDQRHDGALLMMALGIETKCLHALGMSEESARVGKRLSQVTARSGRALSRRMLERTTLRLDPTGEDDGQDKLATARNSLGRDRATATRALEEAECHSLVYELLNIPRDARALVLGFAATSLLILDRGEVVRIHAGLSRQPARLLAAVALRETSKAELVSTLWGYEYHPLRHDSLVHQAASRLRGLLGERGHWLENTESGYRLRPGVFLVSALATERKINDVATAEEPQPASLLNARQLEIVDALTKIRFLGVPECRARFGVSEMTLRRDFAVLTQMGLVARIGRARATRYHLNENLKDV